MAELGNIFGTSASTKETKIEVEMLDYAYVNECTDWNQLNAILDVLKSGKEGFYPDLIRATEARLLEILPAKEKKKYMSLNHQTTPMEIAEAEAELSAWRRSVAMADTQLSQKQTTGGGGGNSAATSRKKAISIPVRGSTAPSSQATSGESESKSTADDMVEDSSNKLTGLSVRSTTDLREGSLSSTGVAAHIPPNQRKRLEKLQTDLQVFDLSNVKREYKAQLEKTKGNESFRIADNEDAVACYSRSLAYDPKNPVVWANRAMAYIRQELFELAESDSSAALHLDPHYVKALSRRGLVRFKRGKYAEAAGDFARALELDPSNGELSKLLKTVQDKFQEVEGVSLDADTHLPPASSTPSTIAMQQQQQQQHVILPLTVVDNIHHLVLPDSLPDGDDDDESDVQFCYEGTLIEVDEAAIVAATTTSTLPAPSSPSKSSGGFVRISVASESDSEEEDENEDDAGAGAYTAGSAAQEQSGASSSGGSGGIGGSFQRIAITEDEDDSEEEEEEEEEEELMLEEKVVRLKESGNALMKGGKLQDAVEVYTQSLALIPSYVPSLNNRAQAYLLLKNFDGVVEDCSAVLAIDAANAKALHRRATASLALATNIDSSTCTAAAGTSAAQQQQRQKEAHLSRCEADVSSLLSVDPSNAQALACREQVARERDAIAAAKAEAKAAVPSQREEQVKKQNHPSNGVIDVLKLKSQAQEYLANGDNDRVISLLVRYLHDEKQAELFATTLLDSDRSSLLHLLAAAYYASTEYEHAVHVYGSILDIDGTNHRALVKRADAQLKVAAREAGASMSAGQRTPHCESAMEDAEQYIKEGLEGQKDSVEMLALRSELLKMRNTFRISTTATAGTAATAAPVSVPPSITPTAAASSSSAAAIETTTSTSSSARSGSDMEKEKGNQCMARKEYTQALAHYTAALTLDATNAAAANNRALAHLKLKNFESAIADATFVLAHTTPGAAAGTGACAGADQKALLLKALCRRAQAHRGKGEQLMGVKTGKALLDALDVLREGARDLQQLLNVDPMNKTALVEQRALKELTKQCREQQVPVATLTTSNIPPPPPPPSSTARADVARVGSMLSQQSPETAEGAAAAAGGGGGFDGLGMVARSSKKIGASTTTTTTTTTIESSSSPLPTPAPSSATGNKPKSKKESTPKKGTATAAAGGSPPLSMAAAPTEPPKTVYELERVWRGLKSRPELFAAYIGCFKKSTFKKVMKEAVSPDLVSYMWTSLRDHAASPQVQVKALEGFAAIPSFSLTYSLLPAQDIDCIHAMLNSLRASADRGNNAPSISVTTVASLCSAYGL